MGLEGPTKEWYAINIVEDEEEQYSSRDKMLRADGRVPGNNGRTGTMTMTGSTGTMRVTGRTGTMTMTGSTGTMTGRTGTMRVTGIPGRTMIVTQTMIQTPMDRSKEASEKIVLGEVCIIR